MHLLPQYRPIHSTLAPRTGHSRPGSRTVSGGLGSDAVKFSGKARVLTTLAGTALLGWALISSGRISSLLSPVRRPDPQVLKTLLEIQDRPITTCNIDLSDIKDDLWVSRDVAYDVKRQLAQQTESYRFSVDSIQRFQREQTEWKKKLAQVEKTAKASKQEMGRLKREWKTLLQNCQVVLTQSGLTLHYKNLLAERIHELKMLDISEAVLQRLSDKAEAGNGSLSDEEILKIMVTYFEEQSDPNTPEAPERLLFKFLSTALGGMDHPPSDESDRIWKQIELGASKAQDAFSETEQELTAMVNRFRSNTKLSETEKAEFTRLFHQYDERRSTQSRWKTAEMMIWNLGKSLHSGKGEELRTALEKCTREKTETQHDIPELKAVLGLIPEVAGDAALSDEAVAMLRKQLQKHYQERIRVTQRQIEGHQEMMDKAVKTLPVMARDKAKTPWPENLSIFCGTEQSELGWSGKDLENFCRAAIGSTSLTQAMNKASQTAFIRYAPKDVNFLDCAYEKGTYVQIPQVSLGKNDCWNVAESRPRKLILVVGQPKQSDFDNYEQYAKRIQNFFVHQYRLNPDKDIYTVTHQDYSKLSDIFDEVAKTGDKTSEYSVVLIGHGKSLQAEGILSGSETREHQGSMAGSFWLNKQDDVHLEESELKNQIAKLKHFHSGVLLGFCCHSSALLAEQKQALENLTAFPYTAPKSNPFLSKGFRAKT